MMNIRSIAPVLVIIIALVGLPSIIQASSESDRGNSGYFSVFYPRIKFRGNDQIDAGDGAGIRFGGVAGQVFEAYLSAFRTWHDNGPYPEVKFSGLTGDIKLAIPLFDLVAPYASIGIGRYVLEDHQTVYRGNQDGSSINGYQVGGGLDFHLSDLFTLNLGYTRRRMLFDRGTPGDSEIHDQVREFDAGLAVHFH